VSIELSINAGKPLEKDVCGFLPRGQRYAIFLNVS